ncbi:MAG: hypothetical protein L6Q47_04320 [Ignavibacteriaceae bacterium]|nr:hypothetical protein [Ignavibacteriaceae bacterium]
MDKSKDNDKSKIFNEKYEALKKSIEKKHGTKVFMVLSTDESDADWMYKREKANKDSSKKS